MPPFCTKPKAKKATMTKTALVPSSSFKPEERVSATSGGGEPSAPQLQVKQDSVADEMPGENPDAVESDFHGPGDESSQGEKQRIHDFTNCRWGAQMVLSGEWPEALQHGAIAETPEGDQLVSVSICRDVCPHLVGCYGLEGDQADEAEERIAKREALSGGISHDQSEYLIAGKIAQMKVAEDVACRLLVSKGFSAQATAGIMRLVEGMQHG